MKGACKYCNHTGMHLCRGSIDAYNASLSPEERHARSEQRQESLRKAMEASKRLREMGIELVCG